MYYIHEKKIDSDFATKITSADLERLTFNVAPFGPINRCRRFTNLSLFRTRDPILIMSHDTESSRTLIA